MPTFQHPAIFSAEHRPLTLLDVIAPKCPLYDAIADFRRIPDDKAADGWTGLTVIDGRLHRLRAGGPRGGPRSGEMFRRGSDGPGVYARDLETGHVLELLAKREAVPPVRLDLLDAIPFGWSSEICCDCKSWRPMAHTPRRPMGKWRSADINERTTRDEDA